MNAAGADLGPGIDDNALCLSHCLHRQGNTARATAGSAHRLLCNWCLEGLHCVYTRATREM